MNSFLTTGRTRTWTNPFWGNLIAVTAICPDGRVRKIRLNQSADTFFSHPGRTTIAGHAITGYVSHGDDREYHFTPHRTHKNYVALFGVPLSCNQCRLTTVNGIPVHEAGCPNERKQWNPIEGEWVQLYPCPECGTKYANRDDAGNCCSDD